MFFNFWQETYSDFIIQEAIAHPSGQTPIPGFIFSKQVDNLEIIYFAVQNKWKSKNGQDALAYARALSYNSIKEPTNLGYKCIMAFNNPEYKDLDKDILSRINQLTQPEDALQELFDFITDHTTLPILLCAGLTCYAAYINYNSNDYDNL